MEGWTLLNFLIIQFTRQMDIAAILNFYLAKQFSIVTFLTTTCRNTRKLAFTNFFKLSSSQDRKEGMSKFQGLLVCTLANWLSGNLQWGPQWQKTVSHWCWVLHWPCWECMGDHVSEWCETRPQTLLPRCFLLPYLCLWGLLSESWNSVQSRWTN